MTVLCWRSLDGVFPGQRSPRHGRATRVAWARMDNL